MHQTAPTTAFLACTEAAATAHHPAAAGFLLGAAKLAALAACLEAGHHTRLAKAARP